ncbi:MAG TPA: MFS transporter [Plantibacter sp.]|uniref:MFS transporter n=1 Tax=Plantibacter sp. TaxID=1871045 RepID=UPI002C52DDB1|nr:MFS transporter [Plantibacter sp.]
MSAPALPAQSNRLPLTPKRTLATFSIGVVGFMSANLVPYMMAALEQSLGIDTGASGTVLTACLLATAISCLLVTRLAEGERRTTVARVGLLVAALGFGTAAFAPAILWLTIGAVVLGGIGAGGAVAAGGAALAAFRNPNRVAGINGLTNRAFVSIVLAAIPLIGIGMQSTFGLLAALAVLVFLIAGWLPSAPLVEIETQAVQTTVATKPVDAAKQRRITIAGFALLTMFAVWAVSEDSLWAMGIKIGTQQAQLTPEQAGLALSASTAVGLVAATILAVVGARGGRALPLAFLLALGGALKLSACLATDPTVFLWSFIAWNTVYTVAFLYFIATATALDAGGRWSGPVLGVYLIGSSFAPLVGAWLAQLLGVGGLGIVLTVISWGLIVPLVLVARLSSRVERDETAAQLAKPRGDLNTIEAGAI